MLRQRYPRLWRFFGARLATDNYLGLHLTIGLLVTLAAMVGFGALADAVADQEELTEFDQQLAASLHQNGTIDQIGIFEAITRFGDYWTLVCLGFSGFANIAHQSPPVASDRLGSGVGWKRVFECDAQGPLSPRPAGACQSLAEGAGMELSQRTRNGFTGRLGNARLHSHRRLADPISTHDYCRDHSIGSRDRLQSNIPWGAFLHRRSRRLRGRVDVTSNLCVRLRSYPTS